VNELLANALFTVTALIYGAASVLFVAYLIFGIASNAVVFGSASNAVAGRALAPSAIGPRLVGAGAALHGAHIVVSSFASLGTHICPINSVHFMMSVMSMLMCVAYLAVRGRYRIDVVGAFVAPLALVSLLASRFVGADVAPRFKSALLPVHVTMNLLGIALFTLAFGAAVLYLVQERLLKEKHLAGLFQRLPPLDSLDRAEHKFLLGGFPLLTVGVLIGTLWAKQIAHGGDLIRAALGYATWALIAGVLLLRAAAGWRGRRAAYGTIAGFGFAVLVLILYLLRGSEAVA
jgi:ABC-type uncharacterized transport system permease subunit